MAFIYDMVDTWNNAGTTFTAIKMNVTDSASQAASLLMDLQVGGISQFSIDKGGHATFPLATFANPAIKMGACGIYTEDEGGTGFSMTFKANAGDVMDVRYEGVSVLGDLPLGFNPVNAQPPRTRLYEDGAAYTIGMRNGTNPQSFRVYGTFTDASNYERLNITYDGSQYDIRTQSAGTGTQKKLLIGTAGDASLQFVTQAATRWEVNGSSGHFLAITDNTYDIGANGANRPRNLYLGASCFLGVSESIVSNSTGWLRFISDGVIRISDADDNGFDRLQFGGSTSSFPALKRSSTALQARLADDSDYAEFDCGVLRANNTFFHGLLRNAATGVTINSGTGSPEGVVTAEPGSIYMNTSGGTDTTLYTKNSGSGNTGWVAVDNV